MNTENSHSTYKIVPCAIYETNSVSRVPKTIIPWVWIGRHDNSQNFATYRTSHHLHLAWTPELAHLLTYSIVQFSLSHSSTFAASRISWTCTVELHIENIQMRTSTSHSWKKKVGHIIPYIDYTVSIYEVYNYQLVKSCQNNSETIQIALKSGRIARLQFRGGINIQKYHNQQSNTCCLMFSSS